MHDVCRDSATRKSQVAGKPGLERAQEWAQEWAQDKNGDVTPESVSAGSTSMAAWQCERGCKECGRPREWRALVSARYTVNCACPICAGNRVWPCQSLAGNHKALMDEWDYKANKGLHPESVGCLSNRKVAWRCLDCGHRWSAEIGSHVRQGAGCPSCAMENRKHSKRGLVKDQFPDIFAEIHPTRNADIDVSSLTCGSDKELWWLCMREDGRPEGCQCEHAWKTRVGKRCKQNCPTGCPYHAGRAVCACDSIARLHPDLVDQYWCSEMNEGLNAEAIGARSRQKVWWEHLCLDGHMHRQQLEVYNVVRGFKRHSRMSCRTCAKRGMSAHNAEHRGRLIDRD